MPTSEPQGNLFKLIGQRVARLRTQADINQAELARRVGVARTSITNLEGGRQRATLDHLHRIADVLDIELRDLIPSRAELGRTAAPVEEVLPQDVVHFLRDHGARGVGS